MSATTFKNSKPPSRQVTEQAVRVPHRSCEAATARAGGDGERWLRAGRKAGTGKTSRQILKNVKFNIDQKVVYLVSDPISGVGGAVGRQGWWAPKGAIAKVAEMTELPFPELCWAFAGGKDWLARGLEGAGHSPSKRRAEELCRSSRTRPRGRGFPCGWEGESCL